MKKVVIALLLIAAFSVFTEAADREGTTGRLPETRQENREQGKQAACHCCEKCLAAKKDVKPGEEAPPATGGCRECCQRCGSEPKVLDKANPPEIIKPAPPPPHDGE